MCGNIACAVNTLDNEQDIPPVWRAHELSKLQGPRAEHPDRRVQKERGTQRPLQGDLGEGVGESCVVEYDDECDERNYCVPEDESAMAKGDYVSLLDNPEKFTGYAGEGAHMVWDAIYKENCFSKQPENQETRPSSPGQLFQAANDLRYVLQANSNPTEFLVDDTCLEKRVFYRVISGMHASISTHLCHDYLDQKTGTWGPNLACYKERLAQHPDRVSNVYFNYALVLRAIGKLRPYLQNYTFCSGDVEQDLETKAKVLALADKAASAPTIFDESLMFQDPASGIELKEDFRQRFRNVSRLMDCVGCDKCRLWGKLQTAGYGTALKVLFEYGTGEDFYLQRTELVALINTLGRISNSISALTDFRSKINTRSQTTTTTTTSAEDAPLPPGQISNENPSNDFPKDDFEDWEGEPLNSTYPEDTMETVMDELELIWRTVKHILREWWGLPKKLFMFLTFELNRIWAYWLGLPMPQIVYEWVTPPSHRRGRDEL
jgi:ERO1-like protein beta